ncbi:MAG: tautomerase [Rickettsiales bacterium]|nr:tautomerase [Rickettsiales bacterium]
MPHLQFEINKKISDSQKMRFIKFATNKFSEIMKTGTAHIAISLREIGKNNISLGRANEGESVCLMNLDIRKGRSKEQITKLVRTYIDSIQENFGIKISNQYVTITEHSGEDFQLYEGCLKNYKIGDDPLG